MRRCLLLDEPRPHDYLWWTEVDAHFDEIVKECPWARLRLFRIIKSNPQNFTQFWNVVGKVGRDGVLRRELIRWVLSRKPNVFTRWLLSKWWNDLTLPQRYRAFKEHGAMPSFDVLFYLPGSWFYSAENPFIQGTAYEILLRRPELAPYLKDSLSLSQRKRLVKRFPFLLYILDDLPPCEKLKVFWYLAKRKVEFLPVLLDLLDSIDCPAEKGRVENAIRKRYPRLFEEFVGEISPGMMSPGVGVDARSR